MINPQIDIQMFSEFIPEVLLTLFILLPTKISPLATQVQPHKVWKLFIRNILKEHQDQVFCFSISHVIHSDAELGHEDVVLDSGSSEEQDCFEALFNIVVQLLQSSAFLVLDRHHQMQFCRSLEVFCPILA